MPAAIAATTNLDLCMDTLRPLQLESPKQTFPRPSIPGRDREVEPEFRPVLTLSQDSKAIGVSSPKEGIRAALPPQDHCGGSGRNTENRDYLRKMSPVCGASVSEETCEPFRLV